jgi:hypothetical protein
MRSFRIFLILVFTCILVYTAIVVRNHGFGLFEVFFGDIAKMGWPGQFNVDFLSFLTFSALWLAWRHNFSPIGIALGLLGFLGGGLFLSAYLFVVSFDSKGDLREILLGKVRIKS